MLENARRAVRQLERTTEAVRRAGHGEAGTLHLRGDVGVSNPKAG